MKESKLPAISYCITCMNRLDHLKQTLAHNIAATISHPNIQFVVLAYGDRDTYQWVKQTFPSEIRSGGVKLAYTEQEYFKMAHAKNMAHRLGDGEIVVNLDADNFLAEGFSEWLSQHFKLNTNSIVRCTTSDKLKQTLLSTPVKSIDGRIAIPKAHFEALHGYDETYSGWVGDDSNLQDRANASGLKTVALPRHYYGFIIPHDDAMRIENMKCEDKQRSLAYLSRNQNGFTNRMGTVKRLLNIKTYDASHLPSANPLGEYGCGQVTVLQPNLLEKTMLLEPNPHHAWLPSYANNASQSCRLR